MADDDYDDDALAAVADMVHRTGAETFGLRYSDDDDPTVWLAVATYPGDRAEADAGLTPNAAAWRLAERLLDGGTCRWCGRTSALVDQGDKGDSVVGSAFARATGTDLCVYRRVGAHIRRGCE